MKFSRRGTFHVYIVQCKGGNYYTGSTGNLEKRIRLHKAGRGAKYLKGKLPVKLVYAKEYRYYKNAMRAERDTKKLTRKQKKELIRIYGKSRGDDTRS